MIEKKLAAALAYIRSRTDFVPETAITLGSGLGGFADELEEKIIPVGNAAGEGAKIAAINYDEFLRCKEMVGKTGFIELASDPEFQDSFVDELMFPELDD